MEKSVSSILIIQTAFIGDVILTTSLVEDLAKRFPESKIDFLLRKGNQILLTGNPSINEVLIWDKNQKFKDAFRIIRILRERNYDLLINAQRHFTTGLMSMLSNAKYKIGFKSNPLSFAYDEKYPFSITANSSQHEIDRLHQLIAGLTDAGPAMPAIYPGAAEEKKINSLLDKPFITIHPGSVWKTKQLPSEKWMDLIERIDSEFRIYLLGGPGERGLCEQIKQKNSGKDVINLAGDMNLMESAALMKRAIVNYVNDSAPLHLCSAVNAPCIAVFCSTIPEFGFTPLADKSKVVEIREDLYCRPCGTHGRKKCPEGHFKCGLNISVDDLEPNEFLQI